MGEELARAQTADRGGSGRVAVCFVRRSVGGKDGAERLLVTRQCRGDGRRVAASCAEGIGVLQCCWVDSLINVSIAERSDCVRDVRTLARADVSRDGKPDNARKELLPVESARAVVLRLCWRAAEAEEREAILVYVKDVFGRTAGGEVIEDHREELVIFPQYVAHLVDLVHPAIAVGIGAVIVVVARDEFVERGERYGALKIRLEHSSPHVLCVIVVVRITPALARRPDGVVQRERFCIIAHGAFDCLVPVARADRTGDAISVGLHVNLQLGLQVVPVPSKPLEGLLEMLLGAEVGRIGLQASHECVGVAHVHGMPLIERIGRLDHVLRQVPPGGSG
eukprot:scaffold104817_cov24-Tisochrysis_lutea.AAC.1